MSREAARLRRCDEVLRSHRGYGPPFGGDSGGGGVRIGRPGYMPP